MAGALAADAGALEFGLVLTFSHVIRHGPSVLRS